VLTGRWVLTHYQPNVSLLNIAVPLLTAMAIIRFVVHLQRLVFAPGNVLDTFETHHRLAGMIGFALYVLGLAPDIIEFFDAISFKAGGHRVSLLLIGQAVNMGGGRAAARAVDRPRVRRPPDGRARHGHDSARHADQTAACIAGVVGRADRAARGR